MVACIYRTLKRFIKSKLKAEGVVLQSIGRDQEKNRPELILEESGKLSIKEQECILATLRGMVFTRSCFLKNGV